MDDAFLMRVLYSVADLCEQSETLLDVQSLAIAVLSDRDAGNVLHDEVRPAIIGHTRIEDLGHARVIHHGQGLALSFEAGDDLLRIHAELDHLQRDTPADGLGLLGEIHDGEAALTQNFPDGVVPDS